MGSKRVVVDKNNKNKNKNKNGSEKKKKKSCCLTCFLVFIITLVVILAAGVGVGCYFGDMYARQYLDMSIGECFSVVSSLYSPKEKKIVTNGYSDEDLDSFYKELKHAVFLKESTEIDVEEIFALASQGGEEAAVRNAQNGENVSGDSGVDAGDMVFTGFLLELFKKENIDFDRLKAYDESKHDEYLLKISDKGVAAFANELVGIVLKSSDIGSSAAEFGIDNLGDYVKLRQVILSKQERDAIIRDDSGDTHTEKKNVTMATLTVQVKLTDAVKPVLMHYTNNSFLTSLAHFFVKAILPNNIYITVSVGLDYKVEPDIKVNNIDSEEKRALAFKAINAVMDGNTVEGMIDELLEQEFYTSAVELVSEFADLSTVENGTLKIDPFEIVINVAGVNSQAQAGEEVTAPELLSTVAGLLSSEYENAIDPAHTFKNQYKSTPVDTEYNADYGTVYNPSVKDGESLVDYEDEFLKEVADKYLIDLKKGTPDEIKFADLMAIFGIGSSDKNLDLMELIQGEKMNRLLNKPMSDIKVRINDRMLGAIISATIDGIVSGSELEKYDIDAEQVIISSAGGHRFIELGVSASINGILGEVDEAFSGIIEAFLPERVMLSVKLDITRNIPKEELIKTSIKYNDLSAERTNSMLKVIGRFAGALDTDSLIAEVETPIRDMLDKMYDTIDVMFEDSALVLPDIFTAVSDVLFKDDDGNHVVSGAEIKDMLGGITGSDAENYVETTLGLKTASDNYDKFVGEINDKYYIRSDSGKTYDTFDKIFELVTIGDGFDADKFDMEKLKHDNRYASALKPMITDAELAHIFAEKMADSAELKDKVTIAGIHVGNGSKGRYIELAAELDLKAMGEGLSSVLPVKRVYIVAKSYVDIVHGTGEDAYYETEITINKMSAAQKATLEKMLGHLEGTDLDLDKQAVELGKTIRRQLSTLDESLGENGYEFVDGGIELTDFYSFLAKATKVDADGETLKGAVQGLYTKGSASDSGYNYTESDIVKNAIGENRFTVSDMTLTNLANYFEQAPSLENGLVARMSDKKFGTMLANDFESRGVGTLRELTIIPKNSTKSVEQYRTEMRNMGLNNYTSVDYMRIVIEVELEKFTGGASDLKDFLPEKIFVTVYISLGEQMSFGDLRINNLTTAQQNALLDIADIDMSSIRENAHEALAIVQQYHSGASYVDSTSDGVGAITASAATFGLEKLFTVAAREVSDFDIAA